MSEELSPEEERFIKVTAEAVAEEFTSGTDKKQIVKKLIESGWPIESASQFVDQVETRIEQEVNRYMESPEGREAMAEKHVLRMLYGVLCFVGGAVVTVITYFAAANSPTGGRYTVAWGAILFGIFSFLRGLGGWRQCKINKTKLPIRDYQLILILGSIVAIGMVIIIPIIIPTLVQKNDAEVQKNDADAWVGRRHCIV